MTLMRAPAAMMSVMMKRMKVSPYWLLSKIYFFHCSMISVLEDDWENFVFERM